MLVRVALFVAWALVGLVSAEADTRVALVIGNGAYASPIMPKLPNPPRDAVAIGKALTGLGFDTEVLTDSTKDQIEDALARLAKKSRTADVTLLFYAGHGIQDQGKNYLAPVDATLSDETDLRRRFVQLDEALDYLADARGARIVLLDACRDNGAVEALRGLLPKSRSASLSRGLAHIPAADGQLIAFATQPDQVAADGDGGDSPFTTALLAHLGEPGIELRTSLTRVRVDVAKATDSRQIPEVSDSLLGEIYLASAGPVEAPSSPRQIAVAPAPVKSDPQPSVPQLSAEMMFWQSIVNSPAASDFQAYLDKFPDGTFAALARTRLAALEPPAPPPSQPAPAPDQPASPPALFGSQPETQQASLPPSTSGNTASPAPAPSPAVPHGTWLGVQIQPVTADVAPSLKLAEASGALVAGVPAGTPAEAAGVLAGDVILAVDGQAIADPTALSRTIAAKPAGAVVSLKLWRSGSAQTVVATLGEKPPTPAVATEYPSPLSFVLAGHSSHVFSAIFSPDGSRVTTAGLDNKIIVWDALSGERLTTVEGPDVNSFAAFSPDGRRVATGDTGNTVSVWDTSSGRVLATLKGHTGEVRRGAFSADGSRIVTGSEDKTARVWNAASGKLLATMTGHADEIWGVAFWPDGRWILTAGADDTTMTWDAASGRQLSAAKGHIDPVAISPDGSRILTGNTNKTAELWDAKSGRFLFALTGHTEFLSWAAFSSDGTRIVTTASDQTARIWDAGSGSLLATLSGHTDRVNFAVFSPDGTRLVTTSDDDTARIWNVDAAIAAGTATSKK